MEELKDLLLTFKEKPPEFVFNDIIERSPIPGLQIEGIESSTSFPICSEQAKKITNIAHKSFPSKDEPRLYVILSQFLFFLRLYFFDQRTSCEL